MTNTANNYCVILAGGKGKRLWPVSREEYPKQFLDFFSEGRTQLQQTYDRFLQFIPKENIFVTSSKQYLELVREQLPDVCEDNLLVEPIHRNTAPCVAWAAYRISKINPKANIIVTPSDQSITKIDAFEEDMQIGLRFVANHDALLTFGIQPTRPEQAYGYIQEGDVSDYENIRQVRAFTEKPDRTFAEMFVESGEWLWNTGLYLSNVDYLIQSSCNFLPVVLRNFEQDLTAYSIAAENDYVKQNYISYPNMSIDFGIFEKSENVYVMKGNFGWADLGTWHGIYEAKARSVDDNVIIDSEVFIDNAKNNIVKLPKGKLAIIDGLEGFIVAENDGVLVICKKDNSSSTIRKYVNEVQLKYGIDKV